MASVTICCVGGPPWIQKRLLGGLVAQPRDQEGSRERPISHRCAEGGVFGQVPGYQGRLDPEVETSLHYDATPAWRRKAHGARFGGDGGQDEDAAPRQARLRGDCAHVRHKGAGMEGAAYVGAKGTSHGNGKRGVKASLCVVHKTTMANRE